MIVDDLLPKAGSDEMKILRTYEELQDEEAAKNCKLDAILSSLQKHIEGGKIVIPDECQNTFEELSKKPKMTIRYLLDYKDKNPLVLTQKSKLIMNRLE